MGVTLEGGPQQQQALSARPAHQAETETAAGSGRRIAAAEAAAASAAVGFHNESPQYATGGVELPNEIWGEIASFSSRTDVLNLRTTSTTLRSQADMSITTMTIADGQGLRAFSDAGGFEQLETLRIDVIDQASTDYFAQALAARPRPGLTLELMQGYANLRTTLTILSRVPLAGLVLKSPNLDAQVLYALRQFSVPITLIGRFSQHHYAALSCIPALTSLLVLSPDFGETAARHLSSHDALRLIALPLTPDVSARCVGLLASIPSLRHWRLNELVYAFCPLSTAVAEALAANRFLEKLVIRTHSQPISGSSFQALSHSATLKKLEISVCPSLEYLANLTALENLHLDGGCHGSPPVSQQAAASVASLVKLRSLRLVGTQFAPDALTTLLTVSPATKLYLKHVRLDDEQLALLMRNMSLRELALVDAALTPEQVAMLLAHPTLSKLRIDHQEYRLLSGACTRV